MLSFFNKILENGMSCAASVFWNLRIIISKSLCAYLLHISRQFLSLLAIFQNVITFISPNTTTLVYWSNYCGINFVNATLARLKFFRSTWQISAFNLSLVMSQNVAQSENFFVKFHFSSFLALNSASNYVTDDWENGEEVEKQVQERLKQVQFKKKKTRR